MTKSIKSQRETLLVLLTGRVRPHVLHETVLLFIIRNIPESKDTFALTLNNTLTFVGFGKL